LLIEGVRGGLGLGQSGRKNAKGRFASWRSRRRKRQKGGKETLRQKEESAQIIETGGTNKFVGSSQKKKKKMQGGGIGKRGGEVAIHKVVKTKERGKLTEE